MSVPMQNFREGKRTVVYRFRIHVTNFCWNGALLPRYKPANPTVIMNPGDVDYNICLQILNPRGFGGTSTLYIFFLWYGQCFLDEPLITFTYRASGVGIDGIGALKYILKICTPNPAERLMFRIAGGRSSFGLLTWWVWFSRKRDCKPTNKVCVSTIPTSSDMKTGIYTFALSLSTSKSYGSKTGLFSHR